MPIYEYLAVVSLRRTNWASISGLPESSRPEVAETSTFYVWRPNGEVDELPAGDTGVFPLFNELGQDGWKLVTSDILDSVVHTYMAGDGYYGHKEVGRPVRQSWIFMREVRT